MDKISLETSEKHPSDTHTDTTIDNFGKQTSSASQISLSDTSWSDASIKNMFSPEKTGDETEEKLIELTESGIDSKKRLNWGQYLKDDKYILDLTNFERNRKSCHSSKNIAIKKDLNRTRAEDAYFQKKSNLGALLEVASFYCEFNNIEYQQGLLEIITPFVKLRSQSFRTRHCYAHFASFMRNYFPNILTPILVNGITELPHLNATINYCGVLISYHANKVSNVLRELDLDIRTFITPWILTLFCKGTKMNLIYEIFTRYMEERDKLFIIYLVVALILQKENELISYFEKKEETQLLVYLTRKLKEDAITSSHDIESLFREARRIKSQTPRSFETIISQIGLLKTQMLSLQECSDYLAQVKEPIMQIYPFEAANFLISKNFLILEEGDAVSNKEIDFKFLDCRLKKDEGVLPNSLELPEAAFTNFEDLKSFVKDSCSTETNSHFILLKTSNCDREEDSLIQTIIHLLRAEDKNYVSIATGGFKAIVKEMEQRNISVPLIRKKKYLLMERIRSFFH